MGYSLLQIPELIQHLFLHFEKYLSKRRTVAHTGTQHITYVKSKEELSENVSHVTMTTNPNYDVLRMMQSEIERISQEAIENFALKINEKKEELLKGNK